MKTTRAKLLLTTTSVLGLALGFAARAQAPWLAQQPSPVVHPDRTVTFYFTAPTARRVELNGQFLKSNQPLRAGSNGVWSVTVGPVEPNLYPYDDYLKTRKIEHRSLVTEGGHTWMNARHYLSETLQLYFQ